MKHWTLKSKLIAASAVTVGSVCLPVVEGGLAGAEKLGMKPGDMYATQALHAFVGVPVKVAAYAFSGRIVDDGTTIFTKNYVDGMANSGGLDALRQARARRPDHVGLQDSLKSAFDAREELENATENLKRTQQAQCAYETLQTGRRPTHCPFDPTQR